MKNEKKNYSRWAQKIFLVVGHIPVEIFLLINRFFDATHARNRTGTVSLINDCFFFPSSVKQ